MGKSNRLLLKLIKASGGWENFLYETLKEVCTEIDLTDVGASLCDTVVGALEIITHYEEVRLDKIPPEEVELIPSAVVRPERIQPKAVPAAKPVRAPSPPVVPLKKTVKVGVDSEAGWCQGQLPLPAGYRIVNKERLIVTTTNGMVLAQGNNDGQVRGDVTGQISNYGKYRLVFKEASIGSGLINFEIMPIPPAPPAPEPQVLASKVTPAMVAAKEAAKEVTAKSVPVDPPRPVGGVKEVG